MTEKLLNENVLRLFKAVVVLRLGVFYVHSVRVPANRLEYLEEETD